GAVAALRVPQFILPSPLAIGEQLVAFGGSVVSGSINTGLNALVGLVAGSVLAVLLATLSGFLRPVDQMSAPLVAAVAVVPIVALAPVLYSMYGADRETTRQVVAGLATFVPVYTNTLRGLRQVAPVHRDLLRAYGASRWQSARKVTLPGAIPHAFTGLRIASSLAVVSALIAEYFGGPVSGLGKAITSSASSSNYSLAWAYVFGSIVLGTVFYAVTLALERAVSTRLAPRTAAAG
ncbi:ABC transporter permease, partial [Leucobacter sp. M11]|uniref:ABC transporter permease n=1 Tax=Leucobacter sp. M11 TaxID=2993565 RepID=UPI002D803B76